MAAASEPQDEPNSHLGLLYRLYRTGLLRFLTRRVGQDDAADLLQETFIRMARAKADPRPVSNDKAFLFQVASNLAADHGREQRRRSRLLTGDEIATILAIPDDTARPADAALARLEGQRLARALAEMPPRRAEAFRLSRLKGLSHGAIAVRLGVSVRTVEAEIRLALDHCAERLGRTQPDR